MDKKTAFGPPAFANPLAGMVAGYTGGRQLGMGGFVSFIMFLASNKPGASMAVAMVSFVATAAVCAVLFSK